MSDSESSSDRSERVTAFLSEETKRELKREAERRDTYMSTLMAKYTRRGLRQDREDDLAAETRAARRLSDVIDSGLDDMEDLAQGMKEHNLRSGVYATAMFELAAAEYGQARIAEALRAAGRRLAADEFDPEKIAEEAGVPADVGDESDDEPDDQDTGTADRRDHSKDPYSQQDRPGRSPPSPDELDN